MIIVLEGPDGAGKTVLAKMLCDRYGLEYRHEGPPPKNVWALAHYGAAYFDAVLVNMSGPGVVLDRFALGERVYGPMYRGHDDLGDEGWAIIKANLDLVAAYRILCLPPRDVCKAAWSSGREEMIKDEEVFDDIYSAWVATLEEHHHVYDYTGTRALDYLLEVLDDRR